MLPSEPPGAEKIGPLLLPTFRRPNGVAVRTDDLTLVQLGLYDGPGVTHKALNFLALVTAWKVIEVQGGGVFVVPTINTTLREFDSD